jgi:hypothetical protein
MSDNKTVIVRGGGGSAAAIVGIIVILIVVIAGWYFLIGPGAGSNSPTVNRNIPVPSIQVPKAS